MDPSVLAVAAASLLATKLGEGFAGEAGKSAWDAAKRLFGLVQSKFEDARIRAIAEALQNHAERDQAFYGELEALVVAAEQVQSTAKALTQIYGSARVGKVATIGDVHGDVSF